MIKLSYLAWAACGSNITDLAICLGSNYLLTSCFWPGFWGCWHSDSTTNFCLVNLGGLPIKITTFCFMASNRRYYFFFFKFGLAVFLFGLFLRDETLLLMRAVPSSPCMQMQLPSIEVWFVRNLWRYTIDEWQRLHFWPTRLVRYFY